MGGYSSESLALLYLPITKGLFPAPCRLPRRDYQREGMGFQVRTLRLCYRLVPGEATPKERKSAGREKFLTKDGIGRIYALREDLEQQV